MSSHLNFIFEPRPSVKAIVARVSFAMITFYMRNLQNLAAIDSLLFPAPLRLTLRVGLVVEIRDGGGGGFKEYIRASHY